MKDNSYLEKSPGMFFQNKELFNLSESELVILREQLSKSNGRLTILVHPFMDPVSEQFQYNLKELLMRGEADAPILILDSEGQFYENDRKMVQEVQSGNGSSTYFVPTYTANPEPILHPVLGEHTVDIPNGDGWHKLIGLLKEVGVTSCQVDGLYSNSSPIVPLEKETKVQPCVNQTMNALCSDFKVTKSNNLF